MVNKNGEKDSFRVSGTTRFQSVLSGTVPGRTFHKVPLGEKTMSKLGTQTINHNDYMACNSCNTSNYEVLL